MANTFIIRKGDKEWRITGEGLCFGKRVKSGALHETEMIDDLHLVKAVGEDGKTIFVVGISNSKDVTAAQE